MSETDDFVFHPKRSSVLDGSWTPLGLIYHIQRNPNWGETHALVPTVGEIGEYKLRVYCSFLDSHGRGRIGWFLLEMKEMPVVSEVSKDPYLNLRSPGFSSDGTGMGSFFVGDKGLELAYVGFERRAEVKFRAFSASVPIRPWAATIDETAGRELRLDRGSCTTIEGIHDVVRDEDLVYCFFSCGNDFVEIDGVPKPKYAVKLGVGPSLDRLRVLTRPVISGSEGTYRVGRSRVSRLEGGGWEMLVTAGGFDGSYYPQVWRSDDLVNWRRGPDFPLPLGFGGACDSRAICYVERFSHSGREYLLYNGNDMGREGICLARQELK